MRQLIRSCFLLLPRGRLFLLALPVLFETCFFSLWSPSSPLHALALILLSLPSYDLVRWTDGSGVLANCSLCGTEATISFSTAPVCSSLSAEACAILQPLCWSWQHQQVCHFSSFLLSDSRSFLFSIFLPKSPWQSRSTPTSGPPQSKRKSPCAQVISL